MRICRGGRGLWGIDNERQVVGELGQLAKTRGEGAEFEVGKFTRGIHARCQVTQGGMGRANCAR